MVTSRASGLSSVSGSGETSSGSRSPAVASLGDLRRMIDILPMSASLTEIQTGRILHINRQAAALMGSEPLDIIGRTANELGWAKEYLEHKRFFDTLSEGESREFVHIEQRVLNTSQPLSEISVRRLRVDGCDCALLCYHPAPKLLDQATRINLEIENNFRLLAENSVDIVLRIDTNGRFLWVSPSVQSILEEDPAALVGTDALAKVHPEDLEALKAKFQNIATGSGTAKVVFRHVKDSGKIVWLESVGKAVVDSSSGAVKEVVVTSRDITERKLAEEQFTQLIQNLPSAFALHEVIQDDSGKVVDYLYLQVNPAFERITGLAASQVLGKKFTEALPEADPVLIEAFGNVALTGIPIQQETHIPSLGTWYETWVYPVSHRQFAILFNDITARKHQEDAVRLSETRFREVADMSLDMLSRHDLTGICLWVSPASRQILGLDPDAVIDRNAFDFIMEDDHPFIRSELAALMELGQSNLRYRIRRNDGALVWVESLWSLTRNADGSPLEIHSSTRDITERRKAEDEIRELNSTLERKVQERTAELQIAVKELESFSYSISHDLRSPLRAIDGFSLALIEDAGPNMAPELRNYLDRIRSASTHMAHLIDDLLELSRSSRVEIRKSEVDLGPIAHEILEGLHNQNLARSLFTKIDPDIRVQGDPVLVRSILDNLLGNSWKYSSIREETVIEVTSEIVDGRRWVQIKDNGIGFDMEHAGKLFGTFQRLQHGTQFEGTGIGLATVRKLVERHGGTITGAGIPDKGAVFRFTLDPIPGSSR